MDKLIRTHLDNIYSKNKELQNKAYFYIRNVTEKPVDWAYEVWDEMVEGLTHKDNHVRAISAQVLSNLAKSDPRNRMLKDFDKLLTVTKDERFVTAGIACNHYGKSALRARSNRKFTRKVLNAASRNVSPKRTVL